MKKTLLVLAPLAVVLLAMPLVLANEDVNKTPEVNETVELAGDPGITPDSPLWGIDVALDRIRFNLARGPDKAKIGLLIAQERLLEIQAMAKVNKIDALEKAQAKHDEVLEQVNKTIESFDNITISNETLKGIELGMQNHIAALEKVQARIRANENIPEEVRLKLVTKIDERIIRAENLTAKILAKKAEIELKRLNKTAKAEGAKESELGKNETEVSKSGRGRSQGRG